MTPPPLESGYRREHRLTVAAEPISCVPPSQEMSEPGAQGNYTNLIMDEAASVPA